MRYLISFLALCSFLNLKIVLAENMPTCGMVLPAQHHAMDDIIHGFRIGMAGNDTRCEVIVRNALGDINLLRSILGQFKASQVDYIIPIGITPTQISINIIKNSPVISLASNVVAKKHPAYIALNDELPVKFKVKFIHSLLPRANNITLVNSSEAKATSEAEELKLEMKKAGIDLTTLTVQTLQDLHTIAKAIPRNSEAILVIKDHLIVSGIGSLIKAKERIGIPLITSDEGSVRAGADIALGVKEKDIGKEGATIVRQLIAGRDIGNIDIGELKPQVFWNSEGLITAEQLKTISQEMEFNIIDINNGTFSH